MVLLQPVDPTALTLAIVIPVLLLVSGLVLICVLLACANRYCKKQHPVMQLQDSVKETLKRGVRSVRYARKSPYNQEKASTTNTMFTSQYQRNIAYNQSDSLRASQIPTELNLAYGDRNPYDDGHYQRIVHATTAINSHTNKKKRSLSHSESTTSPVYDYARWSALIKKPLPKQRSHSLGAAATTPEQREYDFPASQIVREEEEDQSSKYHLMSHDLHAHNVS